MNRLTQFDIEAIQRYDWEHHVSKGFLNRTRFYSYLVATPEGDVEVHTVGVKAARRPGTCGTLPVYVKPVTRASVDDPWIYVKDVVHHMMAGYVVDWSKEGLNKVEWSYGRWESVAFSPTSGMWKIRCEVVNPVVLQHTDRFKYCAWRPECGHILDYLKAYKAHPRIELLSKAGAYRFTTRVGFVSQLEKDKGLMRFFSQNLAAITKSGVGVDAIRLAYKSGIPIASALERIEARRGFRHHGGLPNGVDPIRAAKFVRSTKSNSTWVYCRYLRDCVALGMNPADTKVAFPRQFEKRRTIVSDMVEAIENRKKAEFARRQDALIAAAAKRFELLEKGRGGLRVILPRRSSDLVVEGRRMGNCLGDGHYAAKIARGETIVAFVRRAKSPRASFVAVEYSPDQKRVLQCYAAKNQKPPAPVLDFVNRLFVRDAKRLLA